MLLEDVHKPPEEKPEGPKRQPIGHKLQAFTAEEPVSTPSSSTQPDTSSQPLQRLGEAYTHPTVPIPGWDQYFQAGGPAAAGVKQPDDEPEPQTKEVTYDARRTKKMDWDDYLDLNRREKAAVDFNTLLVRAREKDLRNQDEYDPLDTQRTAYNNVVDRLFGEDGGSTTFAPETVALLNDVGFKPSDSKRFDDLDDFLGLDAALTPKDFGSIGKLHADSMLTGKDETLGTEGPMDLTLGGLAAPPTLPAHTTDEAMTLLAGGTNDLVASVTRGKQVLENWKRVGAGALNDSIGFYGGIANKLASPDIRLGQKDDDYFELAFGALANAGNDPGVLEAIKTDLGDGERYRRFLAYADTKSKYSMDHSVGLGPAGNGVTYRSPEEFRQLLGLEGGEPGAAAGGRADR